MILKDELENIYNNIYDSNDLLSKSILLEFKNILINFNKCDNNIDYEINANELSPFYSFENNITKGMGEVYLFPLKYEEHLNNYNIYLWDCIFNPHINYNKVISALIVISNATKND